MWSFGTRVAFDGSMKDLVLYLGLGALFTHELDAMPNHEWRHLPLLSSLPDDIAMPLFVVAHVPLFALVIGLVASQHAVTRWWSRFVVAAFLVFHGVIHGGLIGHPGYEFSSGLSNGLIFGGAVAGAAYLALELRRYRESRGEAITASTAA